MSTCISHLSDSHGGDFKLTNGPGGCFLKGKEPRPPLESSKFPGRGGVAGSIPSFMSNIYRSRGSVAFEVNHGSSGGISQADIGGYPEARKLVIPKIPMSGQDIGVDIGGYPWDIPYRTKDSAEPSSGLAFWLNAKWHGHFYTFCEEKVGSLFSNPRRLVRE